MNQYTIWFITGSQDLYGDETLRQVAEDSSKIVEGFNKSPNITLDVVFKPTATTPGEITDLMMQANNDPDCAGIITWMHTFSPSKMWIEGFSLLRKPYLHLHTQYNREIPWSTIDMDFMNLNQSAHGDREHGFIAARMNVPRKVIVGYWQDEDVQKRIDNWMKVAVAAVESRKLKVARFGDNMREVAVTEGDKVEAQIKLGWSINGYGVGDLVEYINAVTTEQVEALMAEYGRLYSIDPKADKKQIEYQARLEIAIRKFLEDGGFGAFTNTFQDLYHMEQLPGLATQRMMEAGYGYGGEGDWKTAALVRIMKIMSGNKRTSFMEDYTYNLEKGNETILGAHMLEVCPTIAANKPAIEVHPLGIGGKSDPARLVFDGEVGDAVCASLIDIGGRIRLIVNEVKSVKIKNKMPNLPVARVLWSPKPNLKTAAEAWILAGGAHHTCMSFDVTSEQLRDWAEIMGIECVVIGDNTDIASFKNELRFNNLAYRLNL